MRKRTSSTGTFPQAMLIACLVCLVPVAEIAAQSQAEDRLESATGIVGAQICEDRATVLDQLSNRYSEAPVAMGLATNGAVLEVLSSGEGTSWTIILTGADGISCVLATGESWQVREQVSLSADIQS